MRVIFLILLSLKLNSESVIEFKNTEKLETIGKSIYFLEDPESKLTIADLQKFELQEKFQLYDSEVFTAQATNSKYWFKINVKNETTEDLWLEIGSLNAWYVDFYTEDKNGNYFLNKKTGTLRENQNHIDDVLLTWLPLNLSNENNSKTFYISILEGPPFEAPFFIGTKKELYKKKTLNDFFVAGFVGCMAIMFLYNGFLFLSTREKSFTFYLGYLFSSIFIVPFANNFPLIEFVLPKFISRIWIHENFVIWFSFINISIGGFTIQYFDLKSKMPKMTKSIYFWLILLCLIYPLLVIFKIPTVFINNTFPLLIIFFYLNCIFCAFYIAKENYNKAKYYLLGWLLSLICTIIYLLATNGLLPYNLFTRNITYLGFILEVWFFSLALGDRINILRDEKEKALSVAIEKSIENEKLITEQNQLLENQVQIRTKELNTALKEIKIDLNFARRIQSKILPLNLKQIDNISIFSEYKPMEEVGGDYFDIFKSESEHIRIFIADATGHGVQAALITMLIKSEYEILKDSFESPSLVLETLNKVFCNKYSSLNSIFSCFIVDIDLFKNEIIYSSAGHPSQLLISNTEILELKRTGTLIGVMSQTKFRNVSKPFQEKNKLLLFTDGLFEEFNSEKEEFGDEKVKSIVDESRTKTIDQIIEELLIHLNSFLDGNSIQDDITIIGLELK